MLDLIPREILSAIIGQIPDNQDRSRISRVSKKLYALVLPTLYESITITSRDESNLEQTDIDKFLRTANRDYFRTVKSISFLAPIQTNDQFRCIHFKLLETDREALDNRDNTLMSKIDSLGDLMPQIRPLFQGLQDNRLRSFHWHLGTCIPKDILGPGGYLPTRQRGIEDLSLITGDPCILPKKDWEYQITLTEFKSLKKFSWSGGLSREYFTALRDLLRSQSVNLEVLKIDLIDWWDAQWNWCADDYDLQLWIKDHNFFGERVLGLTPGETPLSFSSLKSLSFSSVNFHGVGLEIAQLFSIGRLHSLNLRDCPHSGSLLRKVVESGEPINLRSLELVVQHNSDDSYRKVVDEDWIAPFLDSFEGLRNLHLLVLNGRGVATTHRYWPSIFHHKKTLTRLVYHEQRIDFDMLDCNTDMGNDKILDLFTQMNLACIGLCLSPLIPTDETFSQVTLEQLSNLKFLCLRTTLNSELEHPVESVVDEISTIYAFATWAFHTFPNLLFIAFGDFSYGRRSILNQEILHRYPFPGVESNNESSNLHPVESQNQTRFLDGFRPLHPRDFRYSDHLEQFRDVLEACPADPLYRKDF